MINSEEFRRLDSPEHNHNEVKAAQRKQLEEDMDAFLAAGGTVEQVDHSANRNPLFGLGTMHSLTPGRQVSL